MRTHTPRVARSQRWAVAGALEFPSVETRIVRDNNCNVEVNGLLTTARCPALAAVRQVDFFQNATGDTNQTRRNLARYCTERSPILAPTKVQSVYTKMSFSHHSNNQ
jgi:hypothetical protein